MAQQQTFKLIKMPGNKATFKGLERNYYVADRAAAEPVIFSLYTGRIVGGDAPIKRRRTLRTDTPLYKHLASLLAA